MAGNLLSGSNFKVYKHIGVSDAIDEETGTINADGIMWKDGNLFSSNSTGNYVREYDGFSNSILQTISFSEEPFCITHDGTNLIAGDPFADEMIRFVGISNTPDTSFSSTNPNGCQWHSDGNLYVTELGGLTKKYQGFSSSILDSFSLTVFQRGLTFSGDNLIACNNVADEITQYVGFSNTPDFTFDSPDAEVSGLFFLLEDGNGFIPKLGWF